MGRYSGKDRTGDAIYLAGISGDTITRDRVGGESGPESRVVRNPCLNVAIMVQPDKYLEAARHPALRASGALARILPVHLPSLVGTRFEEQGDPGLDESLLEPFTTLVNTLLNTILPKDADTGKPNTHLARLSPEAAEARRQWFNRIEQLMGEGGGLEDVRDIASKAVSATVRIALVFHLSDNPHHLQEPYSMVSLETWQRAQLIGQYHLKEAIRLQRESSVDALESAAQRVIQWAISANANPFSVKDVCRHGPSPRMKAKEVRHALDLLVEYGWIRPLPLGDRERKPRYEINPKVAKSQKPKS
ncbi:MAG: DUF3987 domain-containing protein, partial [Magnetococcales bacterium]|nr:DUF3987 domain-containing protein [Magnetococcales bacterium]